jgi:hypothetical protein
MADELFEDDTYYTGPPLNDALIRNAERALGVLLPSRYVAALQERNGGVLVRRRWLTPFPTSWAPDHFEVLALLGVGGEWGIDSPTLGSAVMIPEWGYPDVGMVLFTTPSGGHDTVMLDYTGCDSEELEPSVVYVDEDRIPRRVADTLGEFLDGLLPVLTPEEIDSAYE